jgi:oligoribonuclease (3'-5' exoribonuclease)
MFQKYLLIAFCLISSFATSQNLESIREQYPQAINDVALTTRLYDALSDVSETDAVLLAYKGAVATLKANFAKRVKDKKAFFTEGAQHIEIRYIRLSVQENAPKFLKYNDSIEADRAFVLEHLPKVKTNSLKAEITSYIQSSASFDKAE